MPSYELVIHVRESVDPIRVPLPGVSAEDAEADRKALMFELNEARLVEVPVFAVRTKSGFPGEELALNPQDITEVDLIETPDSSDR